MDAPRTIWHYYAPSTDYQHAGTLIMNVHDGRGGIRVAISEMFDAQRMHSIVAFQPGAIVAPK